MEDLTDISFQFSDSLPKRTTLIAVHKLIMSSRGPGRARLRQGHGLPVMMRSVVATLIVEMEHLVHHRTPFSRMAVSRPRPQ